MQTINSSIIESLSHTMGGYVRSNSIIKYKDYGSFLADGETVRLPIKRITIDNYNYCLTTINTNKPFNQIYLNYVYFKGEKRKAMFYYKSGCTIRLMWKNEHNII